MIKQQGRFFALTTRRTAYCFQVTEQGLLQHLHYGPGMDLTSGWEALIPQVRHAPGNGAVLDGVVLEDMALEVSAPGLGDLREPFVVVDTPSGSPVDFRFVRANLLPEKPELSGLPSPAEGGETLEITLADRRSELLLTLRYTAFDHCDVITRQALLTNTGSQSVTVRRLMSNQVDLHSQDFLLTTFNGAWAREFEPTDTPCGPGTVISGSRCGVSSSLANSFVILRSPGSSEEHGSCYGFNLLYSGDHFACASGNGYGKLRFLQGVHPEDFAWQLSPGETFTAPEAMMTWADGLSAMSENLHQFIRRHIVRGVWKDKPRPVLINSWESFYFRFTQRDLLSLARQSRDLGVELFVLDDGWFGHRDNDTCSLGDWTTVNRKKLPDGLEGLANQIRSLGLQFGLWVEPEMVSADSDLYRAHPDWILGRADQAVGRHQYILDLTRREVQDHIIAAMTEVFTKAAPAYIKWDMNRIFTDTFSAGLPPERRGEVRHRYVLGLYRILGILTERFPQILFESCASGGNRTDPGMLCYMPQVWLSDNTDALCRCRMQYYASFGYPQSVMGAHVSGSPNHQVLRRTPLDTRFQVAAFGLLGYECDLRTLSPEEKRRVAGQIAFYKSYRQTLQYGQLYRLRDGRDGFWQVMAVAPDKGQALTLLFQPENRPNAPALRLLARGLEDHAAYRLWVRPVQVDLRDFGGLVNMVSPVRIRQGSLAEAAASKLMALSSEEESVVASGSLLTACGVWLKQGFSGTGYDEQTRVMGDFGSRLYLLERQEAPAATESDHH